MSIGKRLEKHMEEGNKKLWREEKERRKVRQLRYLSKKKGAEGSHTFQQWEELKKKYNYCCADCGMQEPFTNQFFQRLTEDHIIPLSKGGSNFIENIQPLCHFCNCLKKDK